MSPEPRRPRDARRRRVLQAAGGALQAGWLAMVVLKLTGIIGWSWWWVMLPPLLGLAQVALAGGFLLALWCWSRILRRAAARRRGVPPSLLDP